jgi:hypothetical protein
VTFKADDASRATLRWISEQLESLVAFSQLVERRTRRVLWHLFQPAYDLDGAAQYEDDAGAGHVPTSYVLH